MQTFSLAGICCHACMIAAGVSISSLLKSLGDLCFPPGCPACGQTSVGEKVFCEKCYREISFLKEGGRFPAGSAFRALHSVARHQGPMANAVRSFKYRGHWAAGAALARLAARETPLEWLDGADLMAPVPLHWRRLIRRGFNQALVLMKPLAQAYAIPLAPRLLRRRRHTRPQVGLNPQDRKANVAGAFILDPMWARRVAGHRILLVDDVYTTGATVNECARVLREAGAARIAVFTLLRAPDPAARE